MTSGKYFNKGVKALDAPDIGHVVRETPDKIVVFGGGDERYDIPISDIQQVGANVLIGKKMYDIVTKYKVDRKEPLPTSRKDPWTSPSSNIDLGTYEKEYPKSLFNKGVRAKNEDDVGHVNSCFWPIQLQVAVVLFIFISSSIASIFELVNR